MSLLDEIFAPDSLFLQLWSRAAHNLRHRLQARHVGPRGVTCSPCARLGYADSESLYDRAGTLSQLNRCDSQRPYVGLKGRVLSANDFRSHPKRRA